MIPGFFEIPKRFIVPLKKLQSKFIFSALKQMSLLFLAVKNKSGKRNSLPTNFRTDHKTPHFATCHGTFPSQTHGKPGLFLVFLHFLPPFQRAIKLCIFGTEWTTFDWLLKGGGLGGNSYFSHTMASHTEKVATKSQTVKTVGWWVVDQDERFMAPEPVK